MKKIPLKKIGKVGRANLKANRILKARWLARGLAYCEIRLPGCLGGWLLQNVHRNKRIFYKGIVEALVANDEVVRGCQSCHDKIEHNKTLTEEVFKRLRG